MNSFATLIDDLMIVETDKFVDTRGGFSRFFCQNQLSSLLGEKKIAQINFSHTNKKGTIRGLHFQKSPAMETKLVRCLKGKVFDVAVDLRVNSATYLQWHGEILSPENSKMMVIPEGFAHGFQTLQPECELLYLHTEFYSPEHESGFLFDDPAIAINWPLTCGDISERDRSHAVISSKFKGISL